MAKRTEVKDNESARADLSAFDTAEEFEEAASKYFDECDERGELYGEAGLALALRKYGPKHRIVKLDTLRRWYDGSRAPYLQDVVQTAYMRIQEQIERDPRYQEKGGMSTRAIFLQKQIRFGGYQDKVEAKAEAVVRIVHDGTMDESDFK